MHDHISLKKNRPRSKVIHCAGCISANTRPHQLCWGDREMVTTISCIKCSQMAGLIRKVNRSSSEACTICHRASIACLHDTHVNMHAQYTNMRLHVQHAIMHACAKFMRTTTQPPASPKSRSQFRDEPTRGFP